MKSPGVGPAGGFVLLSALLCAAPAATISTIDATGGPGGGIRRGTRGPSGAEGRRRFGVTSKGVGGGLGACAAFIWAPIGIAARPRRRPGPGGPSRGSDAAAPPHSSLPRGTPPDVSLQMAMTVTHQPIPPFLGGSGGSSSLMGGYLYLTLASAAGMIFERLPLPGAGDWGIIVTMAASATMSNLGAAPSVHPAYEACWTRILPMSLALLLLSSASSDPATSPKTTAEDPSRASDPSTPPTTAAGDASRAAPASSDDDGDGGTLSTILAVSVPFAVGCVGSVLGCAASFFLPSLRGAMDASDAALAAGCLCSSYVGGTFNFFQTARILLGDGRSLGGGEGSSSSLFGAMAGADLIVMAVYFAALAAAKSSGTMWSRFPGRREVASTSVMKVTKSGGGVPGISPPTATAVAAAAASSAGSPSASEDDPSPGSIAGANGSGGWPETASAAALALALSWTIVDASDAVERRLLSAGVPLHGSGCACIALLSTGAGALLSRGAARVSRRVGAVSPALSSACFHLLFASMGFSANVAEAVVVRGPACLAFAAFALAVHVAVMIVGTAALSAVLPRRWWWWRRRSSGSPRGQGRRVRVLPVGWDEVMVASNAAIGGPATAAAFAGTFGRGDRGDGGGRGGHTRGLVLAATVWGVFGYAVGTSVGVALTGALTRFARQFG